MKELIKQALDNALQILETKIPKTKKETKYINIENINPFELSDFLLKNDFPKDSYFGGKPNGYDAFDEVCLCYEVDVPLTQKEIEKFKNDKFTNIAWNQMYNLMLVNGYKRKGYSTSYLRQFDDTTVYKMFINNDFERLQIYYSLPFEKIN